MLGPARRVGVSLTRSRLRSGFPDAAPSNGSYTYDPNHRARVLKRPRTTLRPSPRKVSTRSRHDGSRTLSFRLETAREEERARLARELHDELGQVLTSLKLEFTWLVGELGRSQPKPGIQLVNKLQSLVGLIEVSIQSVRHISGELRPAVLDHLGLAEAIQWEAGRFEARTGIRCRVTSRLKREIADRARALALFRILQEALTNVVRHAHAGAVRITLNDRGRLMTLVVKDNGRGITKTELSGVNAIGLLGIHERARLIGGRVTIAGVQGRGTTVTVQVPIA
jgi:signal transduction histidine kinase